MRTWVEAQQLLRGRGGGRVAGPRFFRIESLVHCAFLPYGHCTPLDDIQLALIASMSYAVNDEAAS